MERKLSETFVCWDGITDIIFGRVVEGSEMFGRVDVATVTGSYTRIETSKLRPADYDQLQQALTNGWGFIPRQ